jgi:tetratricopeptide (TPR) repeat protein
VSVSGEVAVMEINGLLCKVIFDHNPTNEFYVEESFPLDWMYPYETPSGIIMKINRNPLPELTDDVFKKDHEFWSQYAGRLIGTNVVTYDTSVQQIADFAEKVYIGNNYAGFKGDRKFVRDEDGQKAFSKLRRSIAGMYAWRLSQSCPPEYRQKTEASQNALIRETDFAFKQSFAFCPYSPEAVYRYVNFLLPLGRLDDALLVAQTCLKLDPFNDGVKDLVKTLQGFKDQSATRSQFQDQMQKVQAEAVKDPTNFQNILQLGNLFAQMQDTNRATILFKQAIGMFDGALANPGIKVENVTAMAEIAATIGDLPKLETVLQKLAAMTPGQPEPHYDLAALYAILGKNTEALQSLKTALDLSAQRLSTNPSARDLLIEARNDPRFSTLHSLPEFQKLVPNN